MTAAQPAPTARILYLVHDLGDAAVVRRTQMLRAGGAQIDVAGFERGAAGDRLDGARRLGVTFDADLGHRARAVLAWLARPWDLARLARGHDVVLARNLEMLLLGAAAHRLGAPRARLVYEALDIHGSLIGDGLRARLLRALEAWLVRRCDQLIVSSPAFVAWHFSRYHGLPPVLIVENRAPRADDAARVRPGPRPQGRPWRIGWFGMIRCRRSLDILRALVAASPGTVEVVVRGRPTPAVFPDFRAEAAAAGLRFEGPYAPGDLPRLYAEVDFVWAVDFYEAGANSAWLLSNRLYEGAAAGRPALAQAGVETGRWVERHRAGLVFAELDRDLAGFFARLTPAAYADLEARAAAIPPEVATYDRDDCLALVESLRT
jgi:succinoglycan biosynthesis protein ExoL